MTNEYYYDSIIAFLINTLNYFYLTFAHLILVTLLMEIDDAACTCVMLKVFYLFSKFKTIVFHIRRVTADLPNGYGFQ